MDRTAEVRVLAEGILRQVGFPGSDKLLLQARGLVARGGTLTMLELAVADATALSDCPDGPAPFNALVKSGDQEATGELLVWVKGGLIDGLEYAWWTQEPAQALPTVDQVVVSAA